MSLLIDLLVDLLVSGIGPSSDRGLVTADTVGSVGLSAVTVWLMAVSPDPLTQPDWGWMVLAGSLIFGAAGLLLSVLHLRRSQSDRVFSVLCLTANLAAIVIPIVALMTRSSMTSRAC